MYAKFMKAFFVGIIFLALVGVGGYVGLQYYAKSSPAGGTVYKSEVVTKTGILQAGQGDDYSYVISVGGKLIGVASQKLNLSQYVGKKVSVTGQYSGTTLYADSVVEVQ